MSPSLHEDSGVIKEFIIEQPAFLEGMQKGAKLIQQEKLTLLTDLTLMEFYQNHLTPFAHDPVKYTGIMLGWMRPLLEFDFPLECSTSTLDFVAGYYLAVHHWQQYFTEKEDLLTDVGLADFLATELTSEMLMGMHEVEPWY